MAPFGVPSSRLGRDETLVDLRTDIVDFSLDIGAVRTNLVVRSEPKRLPRNSEVDRADAIRLIDASLIIDGNHGQVIELFRIGGVRIQLIRIQEQRIAFMTGVQLL